MKSSSKAPAAHLAAPLLLFFVSGFAGLVYEVLWMKELGLLFGNTAQAAAATFSALFLGLVVGAWFWGRRAIRVEKTLRGYAYLEIGVASSALLYFLLLDLYHGLYASLFQMLGDQPVVFLAVKFLLAVVVLFPPSFFMGGTLPMMSQYLVRQRELLGPIASRLYAVNTLGAALGAYLAGFHLPRLLGVTRSYFVAIGATLAVAILAWALGRRGARSKEGAFANQEPWIRDENTEDVSVLSWLDVRALAFFSGFAALSLEVLWTRMFAQVLQNSVYSFSTILVTFLVALALGAWFASWLIRKHFAPAVVLLLLLAGAALLVGATPFVFYGFTDGLRYGGSTGGFAFELALIVMLIPAIVLGALFPYLMRLAEPYTQSAGRAIGDLAAINTFGAAVGSLAAGFVLLDLFGLWSSIRLIAVAYACAALFVAGRGPVASTALRTIPLAAILLLASLLDPSRLPVVHIDPVGKGESLLRVWEDSAGIVSVVRDPSSLTMRVDNSYAVGGTGAAVHEERQAHLPLLLHPKPESVFFLGMGTGITAGAALVHPIERVVVAELGAKVVEAAQSFFEPYVHGLFEDSRVLVVAEDGRNFLAGSTETFDVIVADLFVPWKAGVGSLYRREHYEAARKRLREGGLYAQWVPLYQMSGEELGTVARTMVEVFPLVTLWRGIMAPGLETAALVGHREAGPLDLEDVARRMAESPEASLWETRVTSEGGQESIDAAGPQELLVRYCGNLTAAKSLWEPYPVNTDDRPVIEYGAPTREGSDAPWLVGEKLLTQLGEILMVSPPERDPYLRLLSPRERGVVRAGLSLQRARVFSNAGRAQDARIAMAMFSRLYTGKDRDENDAVHARRELTDLIQSYEDRLRSLRERLRELEQPER